jgi:hypothetical protein
MTVSYALRYDCDRVEYRRVMRRDVTQRARAQRLFGGASFLCVGATCAWLLWCNLGTSDADIDTGKPEQTAAERVAASVYAKLPPASSAYARLAAALKASARRSPAVNEFAILIDSRNALGFAPSTFATEGEVAPPTGQFAIAAAPDAATDRDRATQTAAVQPQHPASRDSRSPSVAADGAPVRTSVVAVATPSAESAAKPSIFERLFGKPAPVSLAYASPDDGDLGGGKVLTDGRYDRYTAVYDISTHTVYMPDGTRLEAHSGLGSRLDDPGHVEERMRGATPPNVYELRLRESLFHGVQALRLIPQNEAKVFGRSGLLAHTFMLGPNGDSNGCVSFRNYNAFLQAFLRHEIKRLAVVARLS